MTDPRDDKDFAAFLSGEPGSEPASRYTELGSEEPPPEVDARILAEARHAAEVRRRELGPRGGWLKPIALAATVLLTFSVVMNLVIDTPARFEQVVTAKTKSRQPYKVAPDKSAAMDLARRADADQAPPKALEEIMVTARKKSESLQNVPMAVSAYQSEVDDIGLYSALDVVAEYVAAANIPTEAGQLPAISRERQQLGKSAVDQPVATAPARGIASGDERAPEDDPESLLRAIAQLHASGADAAAGERLEEFLDRYPDHPVSIDIREQVY